MISQMGEREKREKRGREKERGMGEGGWPIPHPGWGREGGAWETGPRTGGRVGESGSAGPRQKEGRGGAAPLEREGPHVARAPRSGSSPPGARSNFFLLARDGGVALCDGKS